MNIVKAARELEKENPDLEAIQTEVLLARGRVSDSTLDDFQKQIDSKTK